MDSVFGNDPAVTNINGMMVVMDGPSFYMKDSCLFIDDVDIAPIQIYCVVSQRSNISEALKISLVCASQLYESVDFTFSDNSITATFTLSPDLNTVKHFALTDVPFDALDTALPLEIEFKRLEADNSTTTSLSYARKQKHIIAYASSSNGLTNSKKEMQANMKPENSKLNGITSKRSIRSAGGTEISQDGLLTIADVDQLPGTTGATPITIVCEVHYIDPADKTRLRMSVSCTSNIYDDFKIQPYGNELEVVFTPSKDTTRKTSQHTIDFTGDPSQDLDIWFYQSPTSMIAQSYAGKQKHIILYAGIHSH